MLIKIPYSLLRWMYGEGWIYSSVVILTMMVGLIIRLYRLGELGLWWDEFATGTYVRRILETGTPSYPSGLGYYWRGVAYHYIVSFFTL
jgi:hypothetical protein